MEWPDGTLAAAEEERLGPVTADACFSPPAPSLLSPRVVPTVSALFEERERQHARDKAREASPWGRGVPKFRLC